MRKGGMGSASGTRKETDKCAEKFSLQNSRKEPLQRPSDRWMIILKWQNINVSTACVFRCWSIGLGSRAVLSVIANLLRKVLTPFSVSTLRKVGIHRQTGWHQNRKVKYPNVKTSLKFEGEIVTFILVQNWFLWLVLMQYDEELLSFVLCEIF